MTEYALVAVIFMLLLANIGLVIFFFRFVEKMEKENKSYIKAFMSKDAREFSLSDIEPKEEKEDLFVNQEYVPIEQAEDSLFKQAIKDFQDVIHG